MITEQKQLLLKTPQLLTSLLSMSLSHNWLVPTLHIMHLHAYIAQALLPGADDLIQYPGVGTEISVNTKGHHRPAKVVSYLQEKGKDGLGTDGASLSKDVIEAGRHLGKLQIMDVYFKGSYPSVAAALDVRPLLIDCRFLSIPTS